MTTPVSTFTGRDWPRLSRRHLLRLCLAASGLMILDGLRKFLGYQEAPPASGRAVLGPPNAYALGSITPVPQVQAWLIHDQAGLYAVSAVCTHLGCLVREAGQEFDCPCHGSRFQVDGAVVHGPAAKALSHVALSLTADRLLQIDAGQTVPATTRLDPRVL